MATRAKKATATTPAPPTPKAPRCCGECGEPFEPNETALHAGCARGDVLRCGACSASATHGTCDDCHAAAVALVQASLDLRRCERFHPPGCGCARAEWEAAADEYARQNPGALS